MASSTLHLSSKLPAPIDLSHHLSIPTKNREASQVKKFYKYFQIPGIGQLAGGLPNNNYFPFDTLEGAGALPDRWKPTPNHPVDPPSSATTQISPTSSISQPINPDPKQVVVPKETSQANLLRKIDLKTALQYGTAQGYPPLYAWLRQFTTQNLHPNVPYAGGPEVILSVGNTDGFSKTLEALSNIWIPGRDDISEREGLLCEEFCYMNAIGAARPRGLNIVPVKVDEQGMLASGEGGLEDVLAHWDEKKGKRPSLIYTVTIGQNPTGAVMPVARRKEIYEVCVKYDVIIVEDEPYWYLQYPSSNDQSTAATSADKGQNGPVKGAKSSGYKFLDSLVPSFLSVDYQGRVVRLDTFSKTVAPGCRLGWITAQPALIERIQRITETTTQQPSGFVQSMIAELLMGPGGGKLPLTTEEEVSDLTDSTGSWLSSWTSSTSSKKSSNDKEGDSKKQHGWDVSGWVRWLEGLRGNYERRMALMCDILDSGRMQVKTGRRPSLSLLGDGDYGVIETTPLFTYLRPHGGMFVWVQMCYESHPLFGKQVKRMASGTNPNGRLLQNPAFYPVPNLTPHTFTGEELARALWVFLTTKPYLVLVSPGSIFAPVDEIRKERAWKYFRLCFAAAEEAEIVRSSHGFVNGCSAFWRIKDPAEVRKLLDDAEKEGGVEEMTMAAWNCPGFC